MTCLLGSPNDRAYSGEWLQNGQNADFVSFSLMVSLEVNVQAVTMSYLQLWDHTLLKMLREPNKSSM